jgi:hypothetical protein
VIHQLLLRDDLTWALSKISQNIQRPIPERKHSTVAPEHPLANRKLKRSEPQLPVNYGAIHVCQPNFGFSTLMVEVPACVRDDASSPAAVMAPHAAIAAMVKAHAAWSR